MPMLKLMKGSLKDGKPFPHSPVWVSPYAVNSVESCQDGGLTWVRLDDGCGYLVTEDAEYVVELIDLYTEPPKGCCTDA